MLKREELTALVRKAQTMDPDAMNRLFEESRDPIYYFALKTLQDPTTAEDVAQDAMIDIFRNLEKLQDPAAFQAWSKEIVYRRCLHHIKKTPEVTVAEDEDGHSIFDTLEEEKTEFIPDAAMESKEFQQTIHNMINALPPEQRSAILLYHFENMSVREIAYVQHVPENTVKSRLMYGRKAIRQAVEGYEKKNGVKLHSVAILPLLAWLLVKEAATVSMPAAATTAVAGGVAAATGVTLAATAATTTTTAATAAGTALSTKIIAGIAAAGVLVGGAVAAVTIDWNQDSGYVEEQADPYEEICGVYEGSYFPSQGETGLTLTIDQNENGEYYGVFTFYSLEGRSNSKSGEYLTTVVYDEETETYTITGTQWVEHPSLYTFVDLTGKLEGDTFSGTDPTEFSLKKIEDR